MNICIKPLESGRYIKVMEHCDSTRNMGVIEKDGHLNIKSSLKDMLDNAHATSPRMADFTPSKKGAAHGVGGVGYVSYFDFKTVAEAKRYLNKWFDVKYC